MSKKTISVLLLTVLILVTTLVGCGDSEETSSVKVPDRVLSDRDNVTQEAAPDATPDAASPETTMPVIPPVDPEPTSPEPNLALPTQHGLMALDYIEHINDNFDKRVPFSSIEKDTAEWIAEELINMGYSRNDVYIQTFQRSDVEQWLYSPWEYLLWGMFEADGMLSMYSQNVVLTVPGQTEETIIVGAHYDSLIWRGGNDNASGMALLLESASNMRMLDNYYTIEYVFFGAEEIGYIGTQYYYHSLTEAQRDNIVLMINADVLLSGDFLMYGSGHLNRNNVAENDISQQVDAISQGLFDTYGLEIAKYPEAVFMNSDHRIFLENDHTVLYFVGVILIPEQGRHQDFDDYYIFGRYEDNFITIGSWHSTEDCIHFINETWPGMAEINMWSFSLFLETVLMTVFD